MDCSACVCACSLEVSIIRFAVAGQVVFPQEKVNAEVAVTKYISDEASFPVQQVLNAGTAAEDVAGLGPSICMEYVNDY